MTTFSKLKQSEYIYSMNTTATNLTILQHSRNLLQFDIAPSSIKLYFENLYPIMTYEISDGVTKLGSFQTDTLGYGSATLQAGVVYVGTPSNIQEILRQNFVALIGKIIVIGLVSIIFVSYTKTKIDDEMVWYIIAILSILLVIAIIKYSF